VSHGCNPQKKGSWRSETQLRNHYVNGLREVAVVYSVTKRSGCHPVQLHLANLFHPWAAVECGETSNRVVCGGNQPLVWWRGNPDNYRGIKH